jgi:hypothetical protein
MIHACRLQTDEITQSQLSDLLHNAFSVLFVSTLHFNRQLENGNRFTILLAFPLFFTALIQWLLTLNWSWTRVMSVTASPNLTWCFEPDLRFWLGNLQQFDLRFHIMPQNSLLYRTSKRYKWNRYNSSRLTRQGHIISNNLSVSPSSLLLPEWRMEHFWHHLHSTTGFPHSTKNLIMHLLGLTTVFDVVLIVNSITVISFTIVSILSVKNIL